MHLYPSVSGTKLGTEQKTGEGILRKFGMDMYTLSYLEWITSKDLLCSTGNSMLCVDLAGSGV